MKANSKAKAKVTVAIPSRQKWAGEDWEVWLSVTPADKEFLTVNYYVRLLVSTGAEGEEVETSSHISLIVGIIVLLLLGCGIYYFRRKAKAR